MFTCYATLRKVDDARNKQTQIFLPFSYLPANDVVCLEVFALDLELKERGKVENSKSTSHQTKAQAKEEFGQNCFFTNLRSLVAGLVDHFCKLVCSFVRVLLTVRRKKRGGSEARNKQRQKEWDVY